MLSIDGAIERIKYRIKTASEIAGKGPDGNAFEDLEMAIVALIFQRERDAAEDSCEPMSISDYKFEVGDEVVDIYGRKGWIVNVCKCERCAARGFFEPIWVVDNDEDRDPIYITNNEAELGFGCYRRIGKYRFNNPFDRESVANEIATCRQRIKVLKDQMTLMNMEDLYEDDTD